MKKLFFLFALLATGCASTKNTAQAVTDSNQPPVYLTGKGEPAASACWVAEPEYLTGNDEPAASSGVVAYPDEPCE
jgi:hypothetical protein